MGIGPKKLALLAFAVTAALLAMAGSAFAATTLSTSQIQPSTVPAGKAKGAGLVVETTQCFTGDTACENSDGYSPAQRPAGTDRVTLEFGPQVNFTKSLADKTCNDFTGTPPGSSGVCNPSSGPCNPIALAGQTTIKGATKLCAATQVGAGQSTACIPVGPNPGDACAALLHPQVAVFRMYDQSKDVGDCITPSANTLACTRLALYADGGIVLAGTLSQYPGNAPEKKVEGYQSRLRIPVPNLGGPVLTDFWANVNNGGVVRTKCGKSTVNGNQNETIKYRSTWDITGGGTAVDTKTQNCTALDPIP